MKKLLVAFIVTVMSIPSFAQTFSIRAGMNLSNMLMKDDDDTYSDEFQMNPGFHFGGTVEVPINEALFFEPGLLVSTTGFLIKESDPTFGEMKISTMIYNLNIPLNLKAYVNAGSSARVYFSAGPYIGIALSGKSKSTFNGTTDTEDLEIGSADTDDIKAFDFGLQAGAGIEISSFQIGVTYGLGLANISTFTDNGSKILNRVLGISVGYKLGGE